MLRVVEPTEEQGRGVSVWGRGNGPVRWAGPPEPYWRVGAHRSHPRAASGADVLTDGRSRKLAGVIIEKMRGCGTGLADPETS